MCKVLEVSESGFYRWLKNKAKPKKRELLLVEIMDIISEAPENANYGVNRMHTALEQRGKKVSLRTVYRTMGEGGLLHKRRIPRGITKASAEEQEAENIIKQDFTAEKPARKLLSDITETPCKDGKLYISAALDCFNGEIAALEIRDNMRKELCVDTLKQLKQRYGNLKGAILHTDRGSQYTSDLFRSTLSGYGMIQSLSSTGKCYDNARMESFFATLKKEKLYQIPTWKMTKDEVKTTIYRYIYGYYNTIRVNSFNPGGWPPTVYRKKYEEELEIEAEKFAPLTAS